MTDSNMRARSGLVVGTAGHIDHGKTSLVYALTGVDTDRLKEEKQRGISIDLGFAEMKLADGRTVSFVDVPGHERFVRNMLAGAAGMEAVMLVVAANEGVKPQTREHFEICRILGLRHGLVVLTKSDLASAEQMAQAKAEVRSLVARSFLEAAPVLEVSVVTKSGLEELKRALAIVAGRNTARTQTGLVRMPVDRSFAVKGFGTVVTGTLASGTIKVGDTLDLFPRATKVRVRGLQAQHSTVQESAAGQRVAVNLAGVEQQAIHRGNVLVTPDVLAPTRLADVELQWLDMEALPGARELFVLHAGTAEMGTRIGLYRSNEAVRFARLRLSEEVLLLPGDRFVIRKPSPGQTVGGGRVVDAFPPRRLNKARTLVRLEKLSTLDARQRVEFLVEEAAAGLSIADMVRMTGAGRKEILALLEQSSAVVVTNDDRAVARKWIQAKQHALVAWLQQFHKANPNAPGASLASARLGLNASLAALVFKDFSAIRMHGEFVALASYQAQFSDSDKAALTKMEQAFRSGGFQPPGVAEVLASAGVDGKKARGLLESLMKEKRLVRIGDDLVFHADVVAHIRKSLAEHKGRRFSVAEFKGWMNISRKFAIPLLEYLDQQRVTKRDGEMRVVL